MKRIFRSPQDKEQEAVYRDLMSVRSEVGAFLAAALHATRDPVEGSTWHHDLTYLKSIGREDLIDLALRVTEHIGDALSGPAAEYSGGLAAALSPNPAYEHPALSMSRSLMEIGMVVHSLLAADIGTESRIARWACVELAAIQGALDVYESMAIEPASSETRTYLKLRQDELIALGFELHFKGAPRQHEVRSVRFKAAVEPLQPKFSDLAALGGEVSSVAYAVLSGATHSRAWFVAQSGAPAGTVRATAAGHLAWMWGGVLDEVGRYTGADPSTVRGRLHSLYLRLWAEAGPELALLAATAQNPFRSPAPPTGGS